MYGQHLNTTFCISQGGGVHGNAILSRYDLGELRVIQHRCTLSSRPSFMIRGLWDGRGGRLLSIKILLSYHISCCDPRRVEQNWILLR